MTRAIPPLPAQDVPMFVDGVMTPTWRSFWIGLIAVIGDLNFTILTLQNFANDAAAAAGGIKIGQLYRNGSVVQIRVT